MADDAMREIVRELKGIREELRTIDQTLKYFYKRWKEQESGGGGVFG